MDTLYMIINLKATPRENDIIIRAHKHQVERHIVNHYILRGIDVPEWDGVDSQGAVWRCGRFLVVDTMQALAQDMDDIRALAEERL